MPASLCLPLHPGPRVRRQRQDVSADPLLLALAAAAASGAASGDPAVDSAVVSLHPHRRGQRPASCNHPPWLLGASNDVAVAPLVFLAHELMHSRPACSWIAPPCRFSNDCIAACEGVAVKSKGECPTA